MFLRQDLQKPFSLDDLSDKMRRHLTYGGTVRLVKWYISDEFPSPSSAEVRPLVWRGAEQIDRAAEAVRTKGPTAAKHASGFLKTMFWKKCDVSPNS